MPENPESKDFSFWKTFAKIALDLAFAATLVLFGMYLYILASR